MSLTYFNFHYDYNVSFHAILPFLLLCRHSGSAISTSTIMINKSTILNKFCGSWLFICLGRILRPMLSFLLVVRLDDKQTNKLL